MGKKVVFVFRNMGTGGAQKIEAFVANTLDKAGYEVVAINMASSPCTVDINEKIKIVNVLYDSVECSRNRIERFVKKIYYLASLRKAIMKESPDIVCAFLSDIVRITVLALKGTGIPVVGSERGDPNRFSESQFSSYKKAYSQCRCVVFQLDNVMHMYGLLDKIMQKVIPNPCVPRLNSTTNLKECKLEHIIFSAGRLAKQKRFDLLINAFERVYEKHPDYRLQVYGDGPLRDNLNAQIQNSAAKDAIFLMGDVEDVFLAASNAEFFVLSSDFEGIPNVLLEAMYLGIPCISTDCSPGGARYLLEDGECGQIVPINDVDKLAMAMEKYIKNPEYRVACASKATEAMAKYEPSRIEQMWIDIFSEIGR